MRTLHLLSGASAAALLVLSAPAFAQDEAVDEVDVDHYSDVDAELEVDVEYNKEVFLWGGTILGGFIDVDSSAVSVIDSQQVLTENEVEFREENWIAGANGYVDPVYGPGREQDATTADGDPADPFDRGPLTPTGQIEAGYFAPVINTVDALDVSGAGNIGANFAAGQFNQQQNSASLAVSEFDPGLDADDTDLADEEGGWAEAATVALQSLEDNFYGPSTFVPYPEQDGPANEYRDRNTIVGGTVSGNGNIGVNAAAGAFNQQANLMSLASVSEASLAEASAGVLQNSFWNDATVVDTVNYVGTVAISGAGNIGVNAASGVGNQQHNSLTMSVSSAGGTDPNGGNTGGGPIS